MILLQFGEDKYIGLAGQDKNRISDTLDSLSSEGNMETHHS